MRLSRGRNTAHYGKLGEGKHVAMNKRTCPTPSTWPPGGSHFGSWQRAAFTGVFIRQEQVTDNSMKEAVVKTQASTGEKSIRVEALGRKGGTKAHPDMEETHD